MKSCLGLLCAVLTLGIAGCGGKAPGDQSAAPEAVNANIPKTPVDADTAGSVKGIVTFQGTPPRAREIRMNAVPNCAKQHSSPAMTEEVVAGDDNALANVVVYVDGDFSRYAFDKPSAPVKIDQQGCMYVPHVAAVMTGAPIEFTNSDDTGHNIHPVPKNNREWNQSQMSKSAPIEQSFSRQEVAIPVRCNIHPWMRAYVAVLAHPYFQVTGKDGAFELKNVPPGTYRLTAWHEYYGRKTQTITIGPKQQQTVAITLAR